MKVLMVCLGNICRSPLAEGILRHKAAQANLPIEVDSAGTGSWHIGEKPDKRSQQVAKQYGIDISGQRGRQFSAQDFNDFDLILAMDTANHRDILKQTTTPAQAQKVKLILDYSHPNQNLNVPDPYFGGDDGFNDVYNLLDAALEAFIENHFKPAP